MKSILSLLAIILLSSGPVVLGQEDDLHPIIPNRWVSEALASVRGNDTAAKGRLINEFRVLNDRGEDGSADPQDFGIWSVLQVLVADLDIDGETECIITVDGLDHPYWFCVLRRAHENWRVIYREGFWGNETAFRPIHIVHTSGTNRTLFYREDVSPSGGGRDYHYSSYSILCLLCDSVHTVAVIDGDSYVWGSQLSYLNIAVKSTVDFRDNGVNVIYRYSLYPAVEEEMTGGLESWTEHENEAFLSGEMTAYHEWDQDSLKFIPAVDNEGSSDLKKISAFGSVDRLDLFGAFRTELDSIRTVATGQRKALIEYVFRRADEERRPGE